MKKLFVSSTFRDMQHERDALQMHILPELNMRLANYGTKITQVDLRWGISTSQMSDEEGEQKVLNVCLEEINKSRPYMIVMLGDRYGWVPTSAIIEMTAKGHDIHLESTDISVTQLEIEYIAFMEKCDESRVFFYFRDFDYGDMSAEQRNVYRSQSKAEQDKLSALKARIKKKFPNRIKHYNLSYKNGEVLGIERFEELVKTDLYGLFLQDLQEEEKIDVNLRIRDKLHAQAREDFPIYERKYDTVRGIRSVYTITDISDMEKTHTYLAGPPRCGKSLSVLSYYMAVYTYQHREDPLWSKAQPLFQIHNSVYQSDGIYSKLPGLIAMDRTFPLYLQLGNNKDLSCSTHLWRTVLYFLNEQLGIPCKIPEEKEALLEALIRSLRILAQSEQNMFLFLDDVSPEALEDLFFIERCFAKEELPALLAHLFFYISFNNQFFQVPAYVPFFDYSEICVNDDHQMYTADYFLAYAKQLGKEMSPGVTKYLSEHYGGSDRFSYTNQHRITRPLANMIAGYFMNFTSSDYLQIKQSGNDMKAIEAQNLALLQTVQSNIHDEKNEENIKRVAVLLAEKFEPNHSAITVKMLGIIYLLTGISFSMEEARSIYGYFGVQWSDLDYISYFNDYKEFFVYHKEQDSYCVIPLFHTILRTRLIEHYFSDTGEIERTFEKLILAVQKVGVYERIRDELFHAVLFVPNTEFIWNCLSMLKQSDDYDLGKKLGKGVGEILGNIDTEDVYALGKTLCPLVAQYLSEDALCGFFAGLGHGFQDHGYERKILKLADALILDAEKTCGTKGATRMLGITLLKAYCYLGYKNDKALTILYQAEPYLDLASRDLQITYLSVIAPLLQQFRQGSPAFLRLYRILQSHLPEKEELSYDSERNVAICADLYTLSYFVGKYAVSKDFYDASGILSWFLTKENFHRLGLYHIDTAISAQNASEIGLDELLVRTTLFMESLSVHYPRSYYALRLVSNAFLSRMKNVCFIAPQSLQIEAYETFFYQYRKAVLHSADGSGYHQIQYATFLENAQAFHKSTGITHGTDEMLWEATKMQWTSFFDHCDEESVDVFIAACRVYVAYLQDPGFHDMISTSEYEDYAFAEYDASEPSPRAVHYRFTKTLCAVLHNPRSLIMKPKLKRQFQNILDMYGEYLTSLSTPQYNALCEYLQTL